MFIALDDTVEKKYRLCMRFFKEFTEYELADKTFCGHVVVHDADSVLGIRSSLFRSKSLTLLRTKERRERFALCHERITLSHTHKILGIARKTNERIPNPAAQLLMTGCQLMLSLISHMCEVNDYSDSGWTNILLLKIKIKSYQIYI